LPGSASSALSSSDEEVIVSLLEPPEGFTFRGPAGASAGNSALVVVLLQSAARYLTFACSV
jgi:hypothetical protein